MNTENEATSDEATKSVATMRLKPLKENETLRFAFTLEWLRDNVVITIDGEDFTIVELVQKHWELDSQLNMCIGAMDGAMKELEKRFIRSEMSGRIDEFAGDIALGYSPQRPDWKPDPDEESESHLLLEAWNNEH